MNGLTLWAASVGLYFVDAVRPLKHPCVFLRYQFEGVAASLIEPGLRVFGRGIRIPNLLRPDAVYCDLGLSKQSAELSAEDLANIRSAWRKLRVPALSSTACGVVLFVLVPLAAMRLSLAWAILAGLFCAYSFILAGWLALRAHREELGLTPKDLRMELLHCILCPPNGVNMARRLGQRLHFPYSAEAALRAMGPYDLEDYHRYMEAIDGD